MASSSVVVAGRRGHHPVLLCHCNIIFLNIIKIKTGLNLFEILIFQSYYVFNILSRLSEEKSILVTCGLHPIGQAAISICLDKKCETYAIVESSQEMNQLSSIFPEVGKQ